MNRKQLYIWLMIIEDSKKDYSFIIGIGLFQEPYFLK